MIIGILVEPVPKPQKQRVYETEQSKNRNKARNQIKLNQKNC